jgi:hypothetical protein
MAELDFEIASPEDIVDAYFSDGSVLLRNFVRPDSLLRLIAFVDEIYEKIDDTHIYPRDLKALALPQFHEILFHDKHQIVLEKIFGSANFSVSECTASRRINPAGRDGQWQAPLGPHLDSFFHPFSFTVNFWIPFRSCGIDAPSLGVVRMPFEEAVHFSGYDGGAEPNGGAGAWNFAGFAPEMFTLANGGAAKTDNLQETFRDRIWTPRYALGDAMMLSNWTLHFTHATGAMDQRRGNVELRFVSDQDLPRIIERRAQDASTVARNV